MTEPMQKFPPHMTIAFVDVETTGLRPYPVFTEEDQRRLLTGQGPLNAPLPAHRVIEIAVKLFGVRGVTLVPTTKSVSFDKGVTTQEMHEYHAKLAISAEDYAIAEDDYNSQRSKVRWRDVNGYTPEKWADAVPVVDARKVWKTVSDVTWGARLASSNAPFDRDFMEAEMIRHSVKRGWQRRLFELQSMLACIGYARGFDQSTGLHQIYDLVGGPELPEHSALPDVERGRYMVEHFLKHYDAGQQWLAEEE
jgi:DNA polymerase III epsilon subunit-like protein